MNKKLSCNLWDWKSQWQVTKSLWDMSKLKEMCLHEIQTHSCEIKTEKKEKSCNCET